MTHLRRLLTEGRLRPHSAGRSEIAALFEVAERDLRDARVRAVSTDRRFATAYNAALQLATAALRAEGLRTDGAGHHHTTFIALPLILGADLQTTADFLDACRARRNTVDYDGIDVASERDVAALIEEAERLRVDVAGWLDRVHPELAR